MLLVGREEAEAYCKMMDIRLIIEPRMRRTFKFGSHKKASLGATKFWIPYGDNQMMEIYLNVLDINIQLILVLGRLDEHIMYVNMIEDVLVCFEPEWSNPTTWRLRHLFYECKNDTFYTERFTLEKDFCCSVDH